MEYQSLENEILPFTKTLMILNSIESESESVSPSVVRNSL